MGYFEIMIVMMMMIVVIMIIMIVTIVMTLKGSCRKIIVNGSGFDPLMLFRLALTQTLQTIFLL